MKQELSLYLHIPFCKQKCKYCDFLSMPTSLEKREMYVQALLLEIESYRRSKWASRPVISVFLGGGTPSVLETKQLERILAKVKSVFTLTDTCEISMEVNPKTVTRKSCRAFYEMGINRISIGLQSANDKELNSLGRIHTYEDFLDTYTWLREAGFRRINVDLMAALPGQTIESYEETLGKVLALRPEHISAYSLILEEGTEFYRLYANQTDALCDKGEQKLSMREDETRPSVLPLPDEEEERLMYARTKELLAKHGYARYEISNYALPGEECRHNIVYWTRGEYLGLGLGSSSFIDNQRIRNEEDLDTYLAGWLQGKWAAPCEVEVVSKQDAMAEFVYLGLRLVKGICLETFYENFQVPMQQIYGEVMKKYIDMGFLAIASLAEPDGTLKKWLHLTEAGIDVSNHIFCEFIP